MAAITAAVVAAGATAYAANKQSKAAKDAANQSSQAAQDSNQLQWDMYQQNRADLEPWRQGGMVGLNQYMAMLGLGGVAPTAQQPAAAPADLLHMQNGAPVANAQLYASDPAYRRAWDGVVAHHRNQSGTQRFTNQTNAEAIRGHVQSLYNQYRKPTGATATGKSQQSISDMLKQTPGYQFRLDEGRNTVEAGAAARGGLNSGATLKALTRYGQDFASNEYGNHMNRLAGLAGIGQTAATQTGQWGQNYAQSAGSNLINAGNQRAQSTYARGQAQSDMAGNFAGIAGMLGNYYMNRPQQIGGSYAPPSASWASGFGNNTGWLGGGW